MLYPWWKNRIIALFPVIFLFIVSGAFAVSLAPSEPHMTIAKGISTPRIALTLDLCMGKTDYRILDVLVREQIPATFFVTGRWLKRNEDVVAVIKTYPELFEIGNHGLNHVPAIDTQPTIYGLRTAGRLSRICEEIEGGRQAIVAAGLEAQFNGMYRDASARYSDNALKLIRQLGYQVAGFSLNADMGASLTANIVAKRIKAAKDGDILIAHMNQPTRNSGRGVAEGILALKSQGIQFVKLSKGLGSDTMPSPVQPVPCHRFFEGGSKP